MRLQFVTIGQNLNWPRGRLSLARKKKHRREFMTLALARVITAGFPNQTVPTTLLTIELEVGVFNSRLQTKSETLAF